MTIASLPTASTNQTLKYHGGIALSWVLPGPLPTRVTLFEALDLVQVWAGQKLDRCWVENLMQGPRKFDDVRAFLAGIEDVERCTLGIGNKQSISGGSDSVLIEYSNLLVGEAMFCSLAIRLGSDYKKRDFLQLFLTLAELSAPLYGDVLLAVRPVYDVGFRFPSPMLQRSRALPSRLTWYSYWSMDAYSAISAELQLSTDSQLSEKWPGEIRRLTDGWFAAIGAGNPLEASTESVEQAAATILSIFPQLKLNPP